MFGPPAWVSKVHEFRLALASSAILFEAIQFYEGAENVGLYLNKINELEASMSRPFRNTTARAQAHPKMEQELGNASYESAACWSKIYAS
ncbi:hypothetical protein OPQ81_010486 [Rhizoctonia solani]|nr:hypothetical protein OPQ81_010486 [Rhizoctonia solani]